VTGAGVVSYNGLSWGDDVGERDGENVSPVAVGDAVIGAADGDDGVVIGDPVGDDVIGAADGDDVGDIVGENVGNAFAQSNEVA
jgi:hypothetical protein